MKFTFAPGSRPLDGFTIKRGIHRGGFGEVYYALSDAGKEVALKLLQDHAETELRGVSQCLNLKHPNLVTIFDVRQDAESDHWVVMEFMSGANLDRVLNDHPQGLPFEQICNWLRGIASGLEFLHDRGLVHRDLKPANIFADHDIVKLGDIGLSKLVSSSRPGGQTRSVGTVYYMAPEVARGHYSRAVDIYALGVMLFEMLTGALPFDGESPAEILMKHLTAEPDWSRIPVKVRSVLKKAMNKNPERRYQSALELERAFIESFELPGSQDLRESGAVRPSSETNSSNRPIPTTMASPSVDFHAGRWVTRIILLLLVMSVVIILAGLTSPGSGDSGFVNESLITASVWFLLLSYLGRRVKNSLKVEPAEASRSGMEGVAPGRRPPLPLMNSYRQRRLNPETPRVLTGRERLRQASGSMAVAAVSIAVISGGLHLVTDFLADPIRMRFFGISGVIAAWTILMICKLQEGRSTDANMKRIGQLFCGLIVGMLVWTLDRFLMMDLSSNSEEPAGIFTALGRQELSVAMEPTLTGYLVFFGLLFGIRKWWWLCDSYRATQFRISSALFTLVLAYMISCVFYFPRDWAMMWAVTVSSVVQLSATWVPHLRRFPESPRL